MSGKKKNRKADCHPDRKHKAHGLCHNCYAIESRERRKANPSTIVRMAECHPDRKHHARGLCSTCSLKDWRDSNPEKYKEQTRAHYIANAEELSAYRKRRMDENPDQSRDWNLKRIYGLPPGSYEKMLSAQGGGCAICAGIDKARRLCVDHCHETGQVRALLCTLCNAAVGFAENKGPVALSKLSTYVDMCNAIKRKSKAA